MLDDKAQDLIFRDAHTPQGFLDTPVSEEKLRQVYDLMKWGPTTMNTQPMRASCSSARRRRRRSSRRR